MPEEGAVKRVLGLPGDFVARDSPSGVWEVEVGAGEEREEGRGEGMGQGVGEVHRERDGRRRWEKGRRHEMMIQVCNVWVFIEA